MSVAGFVPVVLREVSPTSLKDAIGEPVGGNGGGLAIRDRLTLLGDGSRSEAEFVTPDGCAERGVVPPETAV